MKKLSLLLIIISIFVITGCSFNKEEESKTKTIESQKVETEEDIKKRKQDELKAFALSYFILNHSDSLSKEKYTVSLFEEVIDKYKDKGYVTIEIKHVNSKGNNTVDARYFVDEDGIGFDENDKAITIK